MKPVLAILSLLVAAATLSGCASDSGPATPELKDGVYIIHIIGGNHFAPSNAKVPLNATVRWVQDDSIVHNVYDTDHTPPAWSSDNLQPGTSFEHTFSAAGTYHYECTIHSGIMSGTLTVG